MTLPMPYLKGVLGSIPILVIPARNTSSPLVWGAIKTKSSFRNTGAAHYTWGYFTTTLIAHVNWEDLPCYVTQGFTQASSTSLCHRVESLNSYSVLFLLAAVLV